MRNICLTLAYDGTDYVGWQVQPNGPSVQAEVLTAIRKLTGKKVKLTAAGRTDSGVHALGQVANFVVDDCDIPCGQIQTGLQNFLPKDIVIRHARDAPPTFHATYSAKKKRYRYVIHNTRNRNPFLRKYCWRYPVALDTAAMQEAASALIGTHDFCSFESHHPNKTTSVRTLMEATVDRYSGWPVWNQTESLAEQLKPDGEFIWFDIVADGFLYNMVRAIVGTLVKVGQLRWNADDVRKIIENRDRAQAGETAPPHGLYLVHVDYEDDED